MPKVHCEVFAGFIFVNLSEDPVPLRDFLGDRILELEAYPFDLMTQRYGFSTRIHGNWKLAVDSRVRVVPPAVRPRRASSTPTWRRPRRWCRRSTRTTTTCSVPTCSRRCPGPPPLPPREGGAGDAVQDMRWVYKLFRAGLFGPDDVPDIGPLPEFLNKGEIASWGNDQFWLFPNLSIQIWARNYYITYTYWPEAVDSHIYEIDLYFVPPANAHERLAQELVVDCTIEFAMQDVNTIEATHSALATRRPAAVPAQRPGAADPPVPHRDPRHRRRARGGQRRGGEAMTTATAASARRIRRPRAVRRRLGPAHPGRALRRRGCRRPSTSSSSSTTPSRPAPRKRSTTSTASRLDELPDDATRLLHLLYSMILVSYAVNIFKQPRIPDSGAAFFDMVAEPAV